MDTTQTAQTAVIIPFTISCFGVILNENQDPPRVQLVHNKEDSAEDGKIRKPQGWGLPGGGFKEDEDKTPRHAARREVKDEAGIKTVLGKFFPKSHYGEALLQKKPQTNHEVYTFFLKEISNGHKVVEVTESGAAGGFTLADILTMPLSVGRHGKSNPYGIYFSHRERIFTVLKKLGYDFRQMIPNLSELMRSLDPEEVGTEVYWILKDAAERQQPELVKSSPSIETEENEKEESKLDHEKGCNCDTCWCRFAKN